MMDSGTKHVYSSNPEDFELLEPIGFGSSATVYLSLYKPKDVKVAVKVIDMDSFERNQIDELRRETQVMSLCQHPNLLQVYCSYVVDSKLHIVMPYLAAGSCLEILKYSHPEGLEEIYIASILKQALLGLDYLHKNGHIHRDIKAGNLLVDEHGSVLLADFGVSSSLNDYGERNKLRKTFVGTPCWMAPEVMEQAGYDHKADIWSFGITALELATGQAPLAKFPPIKVLMLTLSKEPPTLEREHTKYKYSKSFKEMIDMCLSKDPSKRPSAEKLLQHSFFKHVKKVTGITALIKDLPPIEKRVSKTRTPLQAKLPAQAEDWNFTPIAERDDQDSYFNALPDDTAILGRVHFEDEPMHHPVESFAQEFTTLTLDLQPNSIGDKPKKSRFVIDTVNLNRSDGPSSATSLSEVKRGRFSVSEKAESSVTSPSTNSQPSEAVGQHPLTREASRSSRFSVCSEAGNVSVSPVENRTPPSLSGSYSKKGRFHVSSENGDAGNLLMAEEVLADEPEYASVLMKYGTQLDLISHQNTTTRQVLEDLLTTLNEGRLLSTQPTSLDKILVEQRLLIEKHEDALNDVKAPFQSLVNQLLAENTRLRQENSDLWAQIAALKPAEPSCVASDQDIASDTSHRTGDT